MGSVLSLAFCSLVSGLRGSAAGLIRLGKSPAVLTALALGLVLVGIAAPAVAFDGTTPPTYGIDVETVLTAVETAMTTVMLGLVIFMIGVGVVWFLISYTRRAARGGG